MWLRSDIWVVASTNTAPKAEGGVDDGGDNLMQ